MNTDNTKNTPKNTHGPIITQLIRTNTDNTILSSGNIGK